MVPDHSSGQRPSAQRVVQRIVAAFRGRSFARDGVWVVATQVIGKGAGTILSLLLARYLTIGEFSAFSYLFSTATLLSSYAAAGLPLTISRIVAEGRDEQSWASDERLTAVLLVAAVGIALAAILAPLYLPWLQSDEVPISAGLLVAAGLAVTWISLGQAALYGAGRFREAFWPVVIATTIGVIAAAIAVVEQVVTILIVGNIVAMVVTGVLYTRRLRADGILTRDHWRRWPRWAATREVLAFSLPGLGFTVIYASISWLLARTLIERQVSPDQFNQYAIGLQWFSLVLFVPLAFGQVLFPKYVQRARSSALTVTQILVPSALTFGTVLVCAVIGALLTPLVSWVYGQYQFTRPFVFTMLLAAALSGTVTILGSFVMAARGMATWLLVNVAMALTAGLLLWLLPVDTALGAATALGLIQLPPIVIAGVLIARHRSRFPLTHASREEVVAIPAATPLSDQL